jgi:hypothetical protein
LRPLRHAATFARTGPNGFKQNGSMEDEIGELLEETVDALLEARWEICALRELLINQKVISKEELAQQLEAVKTKELWDLKAKVQRIGFAKALSKDRPKQ